MYDYDVILSFITAFTLTYFAIPSIIRVARIKNLCDEPGERRSHQKSTPSLGGIAIFAGTVFSIVLWTPFHIFGELQYILCAMAITAYRSPGNAGRITWMLMLMISIFPAQWVGLPVLIQSPLIFHMKY